MYRYRSLLGFLLLGATYCQGQIQVSEEPRHHKVFENAWVRILDVHIPPGDTSLFHKHSTPSVFFILSKTKTGSEVIVEPKKLNLQNGNIWFEGFYDKPRIHRVWNSDTVEFHVIDMELLNTVSGTAGQSKASTKPLDIPSVNLMFDEKPVRGYQMVLPAHASLRIPGRTAPFVIVGLSDATGDLSVNKKPFSKKGDYLFIPSGDEISIVNKSGKEESFALIELK
jgi:hypothetical protein